jgi:transposase
MEGKSMAYRTGERIQPQLFPECIDDYVSKEAPVRADDALIDAMNLSSLGMEWNPNKVGCPQYEPKIMLKLLVYGYSYGVRSSRKLEREAHDNLSFIWWLGGLKPDHKTIAEFRRRNRGALKKVLRDCARICLRLGLIEGNTWFVDGSKFRANAAIDQSWTPKKCQETVARIEEILLECETVDQEESGTNSLGQMRAEWADQKILKVQIQSMQRTLEEEGKTSRNRTDPDWVRVHGRQGSHAGYNRQIGVDEKHGLIVASEVVNQNNDLGQLGAVVEKAQENLERPYPTRRKREFVAGAATLGNAPPRRAGDAKSRGMCQRRVPRASGGEV